MEKLNINIDVTKIPKERIQAKTWNDKDGNEVTAQELKLVAVPIKEAKKLSEGDTWELWKTHFIAVEQTSEERENKVKSAIIGDGLKFVSKGNDPNTEDKTASDDEVDVSDIPF